MILGAKSVLALEDDYEIKMQVAGKRNPTRESSAGTNLSKKRKGSEDKNFKVKKEKITNAVVDLT